MQEMRQIVWVTKHDLKGKGRSKPFHVYKPIVKLSYIMKNIVQEKLKEYDKRKKGKGI